MPVPERATPPLPCPECRLAGFDGGARIGNRRSTCQTCNNFTQNVRRLTLTRLKERYPEDYEELRLRTEMDLYPQVIDAWTESVAKANADYLKRAEASGID